MKELFLILFFGNSMLLTPVGIMLSPEWLTIPLEKPISSITGRAVIYIELSNTQPEIENLIKSSKDLRVNMNLLFPEGTVEAKIFDDYGKEYMFTDGNYSVSKDGIKIILTSDETIPKNIEFHRLITRSFIALQSVKITWQNYMS